MKKLYYVTTFIVIVLIKLLGITYSFEYENTSNIKFELIGPNTLYMDVGSAYYEYGIKVMYNGMDVSKNVLIEENIDTSKLGEYNVKYQYGDEYVYRTVIVIDKSKPEIVLNGGEEVYILLGGKYQEAGYNVHDNYDNSLESKVKVTGKVDTSKEGDYTLEYTVSDNSGNTTSTKRIVHVRKAVISTSNDFGGRVNSSLYNVTLYSNTVVKNQFTQTGVYYYGYVRERSNNYKIVLKKRDSKLEYTYNMKTEKNNYYSGDMNFTKLDNGVYDFYIVSNKEERLINKLDVYTRIVRAKIGNKLVTFNYDNDLVSLIVENFEYKYDVVIDPGHGGSDIGASNGLVLEKNVNLMVSKYEKCRYESMGYRVYMIRYDDSLGEMLGTNDMDPLDRRAFTIGYYGTVSKIAYSNHHNGSLDMGNSGFEILVQASMNKDDLSTEYAIYDRFKKFYGINDNAIRIYAKDYDNSVILDKTNGTVYKNRNYYSVLRIPYELYNLKFVIYEPIYMTNANDFNWYYASKNWILVSELKIREYVNSIGGTYKSDNKKCL